MTVICSCEPYEVEQMGEETCKVVNIQLSWQTNGQFYMMNSLVLISITTFW